MNLVEELSWRGMLQDITPGTQEQLSREMTTGYVGFDPTADSLHIGSLVPILLLLHLQRAGHRPIALVGGATGMIGDPSGKSEERNLLDEATLLHNVAGIRSQLERFLDFSKDKPNAAVMANNFDWFRDMRFIQFLRDVGKHITVNYMMSKDSVRKRIEGETGISYTEFAYQMMQGYDFYWLYQHHHCTLQMGGSDQWGNITTGIELIRRKTGGEAFAFTCPLVTKADGGKFGKTEKGNIWLDPTRTSPYQFYQFWLNAADEDAEKWIRTFTLLPKREIESLISAHRQDPSSRILQKKLAREVTLFIHGDQELETAEATSEKLFSADPVAALRGMEEQEILTAMEGVPTFQIDRQRLEQGMDIVSLLALSGSFPSKGEARKTILGGGVSLNREKVTDPSMKVDHSHLLAGRYLLLSKGKKNHFLLRAE